MGIRRKSREAALQFLFQDDFSPDINESDEFDLQFSGFFVLYQVNRKARPYAQELIVGVRKNKAVIDDEIKKWAENWRLERINRTDRNVIRIAVYEMLFQNDIPGQVAINEALEIVKRFGSDESSAFVNGILDKVNTAS